MILRNHTDHVLGLDEYLICITSEELAQLSQYKPVADARKTLYTHYGSRFDFGSAYRFDLGSIYIDSLPYWDENLDPDEDIEAMIYEALEKAIIEEKVIIEELGEDPDHEL